MARQMHKTMAAASAACMLAVILFCSSPASAAISPAAPSQHDMYIVQLKDNSVAMHYSREEMQDMASAEAAVAASATRYKTLSVQPAAQSHAAFLTAQANAAVGRTLGAGAHSKIRAYYRYAYAGFAIGPITAKEAAALRSDVNVAAVVRDGVKQLHTVTTPTFLGLSTLGGAWSKLGGIERAGDGVVIGVLDSGIWPENPAFYDKAGANNTGESLYTDVPEHFKGTCTVGEAWPATTCNKKLVGCKYFTTGFGGDESLKANYPDDYASCRDHHSHGSHTASTSGGNYGPTTTLLPGIMSGMAPHARIAAYKVCFGSGGCPDTGSIAAIEQAVLDGIDVINFSIGGGPPSQYTADPVEVAFRGAAAAGIFIAASAGNSGPVASSVDHNSPWLTTVAASTHSRSVEAHVELGDGTSLAGSAKHTEALGPGPLVLSDDVGVEGADAAKLRMCLPDTLSPEKAKGKIVVCDRGENARVEKSENVKKAGGIGMILINTAQDTTAADAHSVPTVHLDVDARETVRAYAKTAGATATLTAAVVGNNALAPQMAAFSSRGPGLTGGGALIKPDITAPGVDILASVSPIVNDGALYATMQGTSMSSPHIAGIAALVRQAHPDWSPMAVKSAIMTTAYQTTKTGHPGKPFGTPFDYGAGHVDPTAALNPGLVIDAGIKDWMQFLCGQGEIDHSKWSEQCPACLEDDAEACIPANLNYPSIALPSLVGLHTVRRILKSVLPEPADFTTSIEVPAGFEVTTSPETFSLAPGESIRVNITITWASAAFEEYQAGAISWLSSQDTKTRIPIVAKAQQFGAPKELKIDAKEAPNGTYVVTPGFSGSFAAISIGLQASKVTEGTLKADAFGIFDASETARANVYSLSVNVPEGTVLAKFAMYDADQTETGNDIDLYLYNASGRVAVSGEPTVAEEISVSQPVPGPYTLYVHGYQLPNGAANFKVHAWILTTPAADAAEGSLKVTPSARSPVDVVLGVPTSVSYVVDAEQIKEGSRYVGAIVYAQGSKGSVVPVGASTLVTLA